MTTLTPEQARAVERRDASLLVRAGAGTGKTTVLVERFVRAVVGDGAATSEACSRSFTEKRRGSEDARAPALPRLGRRDSAAAEPRGSRPSTGCARGSCARTRSAPESTRTSACSTRSRPTD